MTTLLIVDGLHLGLTHEELQSTFERFGEVEWAKIVTDVSGRSLAFGYVKMAHPGAALQARLGLDGSTIRNRQIRVLSLCDSFPYQVSRESTTDASRSLRLTRGLRPLR